MPTTIHYSDSFTHTSPLWDGSTSIYTTPVDSNYPYVNESRYAHVVSGGGPSGENYLQIQNVSGYVSFRGYGAWDTTALQSSFECDVRFTSALASSLSTISYTQFLNMKSSTNSASAGDLYVQVKVTSIVGSTLTGDWRVAYGNSQFSTPVSLSITLDTWYKFKVKWVTSTGPTAGAAGSSLTIPTTNADGTITATFEPSAGGTVTSIATVTGLHLFTGPGTSYSSGYAAVDYNNDFQFGSVGDFTNIVLKTVAAITAAFVVGDDGHIEGVDHLVLINLDGTTRTISSTAFRGYVYIGGNLHLTGNLEVDGSISGSVDISTMLDGLGT